MRCENARCRASDVWQVAKTGAGATKQLFARRVRISGANPQPDNWQPVQTKTVPRSLGDKVPGHFYCAGCFAHRDDADEEIGHLLGEQPSPPPVPPGPRPSSFDLDKALKIAQRIAGEKAGSPIDAWEPREARTVDPRKLKHLAPSVLRLLDRPLYEHQREAIQAGLDGKDVVIATATASGKSLVYQALVAHHIAEGGTALYLAPINALVMDQLDAFERFLDRKSNIPRRRDGAFETYARRVGAPIDGTWIARYDGGVPEEHRKEIRQHEPRILLTNPEMLIRAILPYVSPDKGPEVELKGRLDAWAYLLRDLRLIVVDELHAFRGVFGAHLANILRRIRRLVFLIGGDPDALRYVACSATIRDPRGTARAILGVDVHVVGIDKDTSPRYRRTLLPINSQGERLEAVAARLIPAVVQDGGARAIAFRDHIRALYSLDKMIAARHPQFASEVFNASLVAGQKIDKLYDLRAGLTDCVLATSALELGIDIGSLDASMLLGYPGSIAKAWQMLGRAGRRGPGLLVYLAGSNYLDQYWYQHLDELLGSKAQPEDVVVDPDNEFVVCEHLRGAALDHVLSKKDERFFRPRFKEALKLLETAPDGDIVLDDDVWILRRSGEERAREISLRSIGQYKVPVWVGHVGDDGEKPLLEDDSHRTPKERFVGAVFLWEGSYYRSKELVVPRDERRPKAKNAAYVLVEEIGTPEYLTTANVRETVTVLAPEPKAQVPEGEPEASWGKVEVRYRVDGYYLRRDLIAEIEGTSREPGAKPELRRFKPGQEPPERAFRTQGAWFELPPEIAGVLSDGSIGMAAETAAEAMVRAAPLLRFASRGDLAFTVKLPASGEKEDDEEPTVGGVAVPTIYVHETVLGGAGLAKQIFERRREVIASAQKLLTDCPRCSEPKAKTNGCPLCVALPSGRQHRRAALLLLAAWRSALDGSPRTRGSKDRRTSRDRALSTNEILRRLGFSDAEYVDSGGMGSVWRAERDGGFVAVKLLVERGGTKTRAWNGRMLADEGKMLEKLKHPHIVRLRKVLQTAGATALVLDWADGGSLSQFLDDHRPTAAERLEILRKIVGAVAYLHEKRLVHRDLKDGNILFKDGEPLVADFGIARDAGHETRNIGTAGWAPPEQEDDSDASTIAPTMDVWALGRICEYLFLDRIGVIDGDAKALPDEIPKSLRAVVTRCLRLDPEERYQNAGEMLAALPASRRRTGASAS